MARAKAVKVKGVRSPKPQGDVLEDNIAILRLKEGLNMPAPRVIKLKRGRPPKPKDEVLGEPTPIRFQEGELKRFEREAKAEGLTLSEWIRKTLNKAVSSQS